MSELDALNFLENRCSYAGDEAARRSEWQQAQAKVKKLAATKSKATHRPLPNHLDTRAKAFLSSPDGLKLFPPGMCAPKFVSIQGLMTFQFHVDTDFVDELTATVPKPGNLDASYEFCFRRTPLSEPYVEGKYVTFGSYHGVNSVAEQQLTARRVTDERYEVVASIISRPNYVLVFKWPDGRMVLANGNHRVVALLKAGHSEVPAIVQDIPQGGSLHQFVAPQGIFLEPLFFNSIRPPVVADYLDPAAATPLKLRPINWMLRVELTTTLVSGPR